MFEVSRLVAAAALGVSAALVVAGCSSDSGSGTGSSASASVTAAQLSPEVQTRLQDALETMRSKFDAPGIQAGVWTDSGEWVASVGVAQQGTDRPVTPADHSRVGSITKTMTATVILQLISEGRISFDDTVDKYVAGVPNGDTATIRNLLEMQSGIPTYTDGTKVVTEYQADPTAAFTPAQLVDSVAREKPMFAPGAQMFYSNTNYVLLGMVIEKVTGKSVADNFAERLFTPLGMSRTSVPGTSTELPEPYLSGISEQGDPIGEVKDATNWNPSFAFTAGEVISTLDDLHKWGVALATGDGILDPDMQRQRLDSVNSTVPPNSPERSYGMGIVNTAGWLGHTGEIPGYNTVLNHDPATGTTIVVMVNSDIGRGPADQQVAPGVATFQELAAALEPASPSPSASS